MLSSIGGGRGFRQIPNAYAVTPPSSVIPMERLTASAGCVSALVLLLSLHCWHGLSSRYLMYVPAGGRMVGANGNAKEIRKGEFGKKRYAENETRYFNLD